MRHFSLSKLRSFSNLSSFCKVAGKGFAPEKLITSLGLYEGVIIDVFDIKEIGEKKRGLELRRYGVSPDVEMLHKCLGYQDRVMLPCPICKQWQPCDLSMYAIGKDIVESLGDKREKSIKGDPIPLSEGWLIEKYRVSDPPSPTYISGNDILAEFYTDSYEIYSNDKYLDDCINACMDGIRKQLGIIRLDFSCTLNGEHKGFADFVIYKPVEEDARLSDEDFNLHFCLVMEKVGQHPSMADLQMFDIEKYQKVMNKEQFRDFRTAVGLYASGVGCGSFVYLRRILEQLVSEAAAGMAGREGWSDEEFEKKRFSEKIDYVESFGQKIIPEALNSVKNKIYGVLSAGVHESTDQECIALFLIMKQVIEELLEHRFESREKEERLKQVKQALEGLQ